MAVVQHESARRTKLFECVRALVGLFKVGRLGLAALPQRKVLESLKLRVEQAQQPATGHGVDLGQLIHLIASHENAKRGVLCRCLALCQHEAARVLCIEHLIRDGPL